MPKLTSVEAFAPATMANIGIGFDILGLAVRDAGDIVRVERSSAPGVEIIQISGDGGRLPLQAEKNTAGIAALHVLRMIEAESGVRMWLQKGLPLASGLGSSAASAVAAAVAVNVLFEEPLSRQELLPACLEGEAIVSGYHADNVAPSLLGGITLITDTDISGIYALPVPDGLYLALITPDVAVPTIEARAVLPQSISLKQMIHQTGQTARLVDALYRQDIEAIAAAMEADIVVEPARAHLMPYLAEARQIAKQNGALGLVISGAGPTLCAVCESMAVAQVVAAVLQGLYDEVGIGGVSRATSVDRQGARIIGTE